MNSARHTQYTVVLLAGDGIGPEIVAQARRVLEAAVVATGASITFNERLIGGAAIDVTGTALPEDTTTACRAADAVLLGAVGGPKWDDPSARVQTAVRLIKATPLSLQDRTAWCKAQTQMDRDRAFIRAGY